jgi:hypothetical protein
MSVRVAKVTDNTYSAAIAEGVTGVSVALRDAEGRVVSSTRMSLTTFSGP